MTREPFIAHSELTNEIYIVAGKEKYRVTEQAIKAVIAIKALEQELFINKPCISSSVCEHDKNKVLDKIRAKIKELPITKWTGTHRIYIDVDVFKENVLAILDKYKAESEDNNAEVN